MEIWAKIKGFENYLISNMGNVVSNIKKDKFGNPIPKKIKLCKDGRGYYNFTVKSNDGVQKVLLIHREVAKAFCENLLNNNIVCHINDVKSDNRAENLKWGTKKDNMADAIRNGVNPVKRDLSHNLIMYLYNSEHNCCQLAKRYHISPSLVSKIKNGRSYSWLTNHKIKQ